MCPWVMSFVTSDQRGGNSKTVQTVSYTIGDDNKGTKCLVFQDQDLTMLKLDDWILKTSQTLKPTLSRVPGFYRHLSKK